MTRSQYKTPQEAFLAGDFGTEYIERNRSRALLSSNLSFFSKTLTQTRGIRSCLEFGANIGMNLKALQLLFPAMPCKGIEINPEAARILENLIGKEMVFQGSILDYNADEPAELVLIKGVLIHINPEMLDLVYEKLYQASSRYILVCEYYNPSPVVISYRGHHDRLFKRDFAGEMMDKYQDLVLLDYGFVYHRDPKFPQDDITWFLLQKT